jgi:glycosyltransferase involved in cell wall biosynthesis
MKRLRICLVGATHPSFSPRLVREADSLTDAGHDVRVVALHHLLWADAREESLMRRRRWRLQRVDFRPLGWKKLRSAIIRGRSRLAAKLSPYVNSVSLARNAYGLAGPELLKLAASEPADWFIAHGHAALPVAAAAAKRWKARLGFDCEDLLAHAPNEPVSIVRAIEAEYLPRCDYVSTASPLMAKQLVSDHHIPLPTVLYNVFPLNLADGMLAPRGRSAAPALRLHWFGQTIGPGRGLEDALAALAHLPGHVELHLRGTLAAGSREHLQVLAGRQRHRLFFLPPLEHDELIRALESFDIGLALEQPDHGNYSRTVTNKLFSYLLAGLAVAATDTPGQRLVMSQIPAAGFLYPAGDARALADGLLNWLRDRQSLRAAQQASWEAARACFSWDHEQEKFLALFASPAPAEAVLTEGSVVS